MIGCIATAHLLLQTVMDNGLKIFWKNGGYRWKCAPAQSPDDCFWLTKDGAFADYIDYLNSVKSVTEILGEIAGNV